MVNEQERRERRARKDPKSALRVAQRSLRESARLTTTGQFTKAARAAQLAERHAKLAAQLIDLDASLKQVAAARTRALTAILSAAADAEAKRARDRSFTTHPDTDPADMSRNWSIRDPRVQALFKKAMEKGRM